LNPTLSQYTPGHAFELNVCLLDPF